MILLTFDQFQQEMRSHYGSGDIKIYRTRNGFGCTYWLRGNSDDCRWMTDFKLWEIIATHQSDSTTFEVQIGGMPATHTKSLGDALEFLSLAGFGMQSALPISVRPCPWISIEDREPSPFQQCWVRWKVIAGDDIDEIHCERGWWDPFQRDWRRTPSEPKTPGDQIVWLFDDYTDLFTKIRVHWTPASRFQDRSQAFAAKAP